MHKSSAASVFFEAKVDSEDIADVDFEIYQVD